MKLFVTWAPPVAVSLLLHAALFTLLTHPLSNNRPVSLQAQAITIELSGKSSPMISKPSLPKEPPHRIKYLAPKPDTVRTAIVENTSPEKSHTTTTLPEQSSTNEHAVNSTSETLQPNLNIQPLNKLTRHPSFLHKVEPIYPRSEQRAGSQAYVLAEVTIDKNGKVHKAKIIKSAGTSFDQAVMDALEKSIFVPGYIEHEAVAVRVLVPFRFNLK